VGAGTGLVLANTASQHHRDNLLRAENQYYVLMDEAMHPEAR
jgi:hypothetical protein